MRYDCLERFSRHRLQRKSLVSGPSMHHGTCVTHVPWCMSSSLTRFGRVNVPGTPGACAYRNFTYLVRCPFCAKRVIYWQRYSRRYCRKIIKQWVCVFGYTLSLNDQHMHRHPARVSCIGIYCSHRDTHPLLIDSHCHEGPWIPALLVKQTPRIWANSVTIIVIILLIQ